MKASVLVIHAEHDLRCPVEQAEQFYAALRYHHVPVRMVRFPDESDDLSRSGQLWHRVVRLEYIVAFLQNQLVV
jgi:dipeptidyl aminopeptidase/acylaminoacyl peptidase